MKIKTFWLLIAGWIGAFGMFQATAMAESRYAHAVRGFSLSQARGIALRHSELEATTTREFTLGKELIRDLLQLRVPFGAYEVDSRGETLPLGRVRANWIGTSLWLGLSHGRWTPIVGAGGRFVSFQEQFKTMGNLENGFGIDFHAGVRFRLISNLWDTLGLRGALYYQRSLLSPGVQVPDRVDVTEIDLNQHQIVLMLEGVGL